MSLLMKGRKMQKKHVKDSLLYYVEAFMTAFAVAQSLPITFCGLRALFGSFHKCRLTYVPILISGWVMFVTSGRVARLYAGSTFQVALESYLRLGKNPVFRAITKSKLVQTLMFMMFSAFILNSVKKNAIKILWIVQAIPGTIQGENNKCSHTESCSKSCLKELLKTLLIGIPLDFLKTFSTDIPKGSTLTNVLKEKLLRLDFPTTLFLSSYTSIYRLTSCLLTRIWRANSEFKHLIAAFLGGVSFYFLPKLAMLCFAVTVSIEISWELFKRHKFENFNGLVEIVKKIPFSRFCSILSAAYIVEIYLWHPQILNPMGSSIISAVTGNQGIHTRKSILTYLGTLVK